MRHIPDEARRGSALFLVMVMISVMAVIFLKFSVRMDGEFDRVSVADRRSRAGLLAESGLAYALHPQCTKLSPLLEGKISDVESYSVKISSETARLPLNRLLLHRDGYGILVELFTSWGLDVAVAQKVYDVLADWVDRDDAKRLNGAEKAEYAAMGIINFPLNRSFATMSSPSFVPGARPLDAIKPDWKDSFTVFGPGRLDASEAPSELISVVCGVPVGRGKVLDAMRAGPDGVFGTADDTKFASLDEIRNALGLDEARFAQGRRWLVLGGPLRRIESTGRVGKTSVRVRVIANPNNAGSGFLEWSEE